MPFLLWSLLSIVTSGQMLEAPALRLVSFFLPASYKINQRDPKILFTLTKLIKITDEQEMCKTTLWFDQEFDNR